MGRLLLDGTGADGAQVIAPDWLAFMKAPSPRDPEYGGQTWLNRADGSDSDGPTLFPDAAPDTVVSLIGPLGQLVIAGTGADPPDPGTHPAIVLVRLRKTPDSEHGRAHLCTPVTTTHLL